MNFSKMSGTNEHIHYPIIDKLVFVNYWLFHFFLRMKSKYEKLSSPADKS